jgi:hypothetical protein
VKTKFYRAAFLGLLVLMGFALRAGAAGLPIEILDTRNATRLLIEKGVSSSTYSNITQTQTSAFSISDELYSWNGLFVGKSTADLFSVSALTTNLINLIQIDRLTYYSAARATNEVWFSPVSSSTMTLGFEMSLTGGFHQLDAVVSVGLLNITSGQELLSYKSSARGSALIESAPVSFAAGDTYKLSIAAWTIEDSAGGPWAVTTSSLRVFGFDPISVPEPTTASIVGLGLLVWAVRRKIWRKCQYE